MKWNENILEGKLSERIGRKASGLSPFMTGDKVAGLQSEITLRPFT